MVLSSLSRLYLIPLFSICSLLDQLCAGEINLKRQPVEVCTVRDSAHVGEIPIYLYPGLAIAQLFLASVESAAGSSAPVPSAFQVQTSPRTRNVEIEDRDIIEAFRQHLLR
jgi:hypothetical protein